MQQTEENIPKAKTYWNAQQYADIEFNGFTEDNRSELFNPEFKTNFHRQIEEFKRIDTSKLRLYTKGYQAVFFTQLLIRYIQDKNFICDTAEINWVKQQFEAQKTLLTTASFSFKEDYTIFKESNRLTIMSTPLTFLLVMLAYIIEPEDPNQNIFLKNKELSLIAIFLIAVIGTAIADRTVFKNPQQNQYTFWSLIKREPINQEIQTLFDYLDNQIKQIEEKIIKLNHTDGTKLKMD